MGDLNCQFDIIKELDSGEISDLHFLCKDLIPQLIQDEKDGTHLFIKLEQIGYIGNKNTGLIEELLFYLKRNDLLQKFFKVSKETMADKLKIPETAIISPYRCLLFELGNLVPDSELKEIKNLFTRLSKATLDKVTSLLDIFTELEKRDYLCEDNLEHLKEISGNFDSNFGMTILKYEKQKKVNVPDLESMNNCDSQGNATCAVDHPEPSHEFYKMSSRPRGICLIINNFNFKKASKMKDRKGTDKDEQSLRSVFSKLGFQVHTRNDLEGNDILPVIKLYGKNHEKNDCFVCCVLSHGNKGIIYGTNGQSVQIRDLTYCFCSSVCPSLKGKPKLFFIQACQGEELQILVPVVSDACNASAGSNVSEEDLIPDEPDFLLGMATTLHCVSYRDPNCGSWYIQSLCTKLHEHYQSGEDIISILTKVNQELSKKVVPKHNITQMPQPWTTLSKKLIFS